MLRQWLACKQWRKEAFEASRITTFPLAVGLSGAFRRLSAHNKAAMSATHVGIVALQNQGHVSETMLKTNSDAALTSEGLCFQRSPAVQCLSTVQV